MSADDKWTPADLPSLAGRMAIVTGANSGIGLAAARELARAGGRVILAVRDTSKGEQAARSLHGDVEVRRLDLADLASVREFAGGVEDDIDLLINNAGVMAPPRMETADGFELQLGTNHLGHFALTGRLIETLLSAEAPRIVNVASLAHRRGSMDFDDLNWEQGYSRWPAYGRSKLANLLFTFELDRRLRAIDSAAIALACHPGYAATNLQTAGPGEGNWGIVLKPAMLVANLLLGQSDEMGALPTLYAATSPEAEGSDYIGPDGIGQARGHPIKVGCSSAARDAGNARRLWDASVELTGVDYAVLAAPAG